VNELTLTERDDGRRVSVHVGDVIMLHLPENAAGGYQWSASHADAARVDVSRERFDTVNQATGSEGIAVWKLTAKLPGTVRIELKRSRPWEGSRPATETFAMTLDVAE
jgi:inhibitor of cysteine peptidase